MPPSLQLVFFPTAAHRSPDGSWQLPIHAWIYQPAEFSRLRSAGLRFAKLLLRKKLAAAQTAAPIFHTRLASFLADNQRRQQITLQIHDALHPLPKSPGSGHLRATLTLPNSTLPTNHHWLTYRALELPAQGRSLLLPPTGLSVISDLDDTIKITHVAARRQMLRNTFARPFASVPGMSDFYQHLAAQDAAFHYVTASPWHLYPFLAEFLAAQNFPPGSWHMRDLRLLPRNLPQTLQPSRRLKSKHILSLLDAHPARRFLLIGDSGQSDPQTYAALARSHPAQIQKIYIRNITSDPPNSPRWQKTFHHLPPNQWQIFNSPAQLLFP